MIGTNRSALSPSLLIAVFFAIPLWTATIMAQPTCEIPLFLEENGVSANVLFIFDSSGSMNDAIYHDAYDPNVTHSGTFGKTSKYRASAPGWPSPRVLSHRGAFLVSRAWWLGCPISADSSA